ncbi:MAG: hypothetical protein ACYC48_02060 [Minisyncoccota bacterium]
MKKIVICLVFGVAAVICCVVLSQNLHAKDDAQRVFLAFAMGLFALFFFARGIRFAMDCGRIPDKYESLSEWLSTGTAYQTVASCDVRTVASCDTCPDINLVVIVKEFESSDLRSYRVFPAQRLPPKFFTLVDGKPIEIFSPSTTTLAE